MAALDFPSNPINGQTYALNGVTYYYNSSMGAWLTQLTSMNIASSSNTQVLFNDAGIANGSVGLTYNKSANTLSANTFNVNTMVVGGNTTITNSALFAGNLTTLSNVAANITPDDGRFGQQGFRIRGQTTNTYGVLTFMPNGNPVTFANDIMRFYNRDDTTGTNLGLIGLGYIGYTKGSSYVSASNTTFTIGARSFGTGSIPNTLALDGLKLAAPLGVGANPIFYVRQSTSQTIPTGTNTKIYYDVSVYDTHSYFTTGTSGTTSRFYPSVPGYYYMMANVRGSPAGVAACDIAFYVNGTAYITQHINQTGSNDQGAFINAIVYLNGSQYVEVWYNQNGGGNSPTNNSDNLGNSGTVTWWQGMLIRADV